MSKYQFGSIVNRDFRNTLQRLADDATAQGKAIQDLVAEGQLTEGQYTQLITTINGLIKSGHVDKSDLTSEFKGEIEGFSTQLAQTVKKGEGGVITPEMASQELKEQMTGGSVAVVGKDTILTENIIDKQVTPKKTTFSRKGKNLFDGNFINGMILQGPGSDGLFTVAERDGGISVIIKINPNTAYYVSKKSGSSDRFILGKSREYPKIGDKLEFSSLGDTGNRVISGENHHYFIIYVSSPTENKIPEELQVELGSEKTSYENPYAVNIEFAEETLIKLQGKSNIDKLHVNAFGASPLNTDNKTQIQNAIDYASSQIDEGGTIDLWLEPRTYQVNGTIYLKSGVVLKGGGRLKAVPNANFDYIHFGSQLLRPIEAHTFLAVVGDMDNRLKNVGLEGIIVDFNGDNQPVNGSYVGIAVVHADDTQLINTQSLDVVKNMIPNPEVEGNRGVNLLISYADRTIVDGGLYWGSGYDAVRPAAFAKDTRLQNFTAGNANKGAVQITPLSYNTTLNGLVLDNRDGGHSYSHALFGHNADNVMGSNLILKARDGHCVNFFSDGSTARGGISKGIHLKNLIMENDHNRAIGLHTEWISDVKIEGVINITGDSNNTAVNLESGVSDVDLDLTINAERPNAENLVQLWRSGRNVKIKATVNSDDDNRFITMQRAEMLKIYDSYLNFPNTTKKVFESNGNNNYVTIKENVVVGDDSIEMVETDSNVDIGENTFLDV